MKNHIRKVFFSRACTYVVDVHREYTLNDLSEDSLHSWPGSITIFYLNPMTWLKTNRCQHNNNIYFLFDIILTGINTQHLRKLKTIHKTASKSMQHY